MLTWLLNVSVKNLGIVFIIIMKIMETSFQYTEVQSPKNETIQDQCAYRNMRKNLLSGNSIYYVIKQSSVTRIYIMDHMCIEL